MDTWLSTLSDRVARTQPASVPTRNWPGEMDYERAKTSGRDALVEQLDEQFAGWAFAAHATGWATPPPSDLLDGTRRSSAEAEALAAAEADLLDDEDDDQGELFDTWEDDGYGYEPRR